MNMFKKIKATSVASYLASVPPERRSLVRFLHGFIRKAAKRPGLIGAGKSKGV